MYPSDELTSFARKREILHARIAARRRECAEHWVVVERPLRIVDDGWQRWRSWVPWLSLASVPASLVFGQKVAAGRSVLARLARWAPVVSSVTRVALRFRSGRRRADLYPPGSMGSSRISSNP